MQLNPRFWLRLSIVNLFIVALLGMLMRYKIGYEFPHFNQKYIQFSHYHFAFYGWIGQALMVLMVQCMARINHSFAYNKYNAVLSVNAIGSYGMLISFLVWGFGVSSVLFLLLSIAASYWFGIKFILDLRRFPINRIAADWFRAALFFNFLSSLGVFLLAYWMLGRHILQNEYLATSYYFLHFQYNGWFFFACMGLLTNMINGKAGVHKAIFRWFAISCTPAYFLSVLWLEIPVWLFVAVVIAAVAQTYAWILQLMAIVKTKPEALQGIPFILTYVLLFVAVAGTVKVILQLGSTVPEISKLAFGFRPVVIAYLHLVLLALITLFILFYIYANHLLPRRRMVMVSLFVFSIGVFLNEAILAAQGIGAFSYTIIPYANEMLYYVAVLMVAGIGCMAFFSIIPEKNAKYDINHNLRR